MPEEKLAQIVKLMDMLTEDTSIPKNVRKAVSEAKAKLQKEYAAKPWGRDPFVRVKKRG